MILSDRVHQHCLAAFGRVAGIIGLTNTMYLLYCLLGLSKPKMSVTIIILLFFLFFFYIIFLLLFFFFWGGGGAASVGFCWVLQFHPPLATNLSQKMAERVVMNETRNSIWLNKMIHNCFLLWEIYFVHFNKKKAMVPVRLCYLNHTVNGCRYRVVDTLDTSWYKQKNRNAQSYWFHAMF